LFQGFQILSDATGGFGGLCASSLQHLKDEYSTKSCLVFPVIPPQTLESNFKLRIVNTALFFASLSELSDVFSPLSISSDCWNQTETYRKFPYMEYNVRECIMKELNNSAYLECLNRTKESLNPIIGCYKCYI
jgi:Tubulin